MTDLYLEIAGDMFDIEDHDDAAEPGKCRMVVNPGDATKLQDLLGREAGLAGALKEEVANRTQGVPLPGHHELRDLQLILDPVRSEGTVVAVMVRGDIEGWYAEHGEAPMPGSDDRPLPESGGGSLGKTPGSKQ